MFRAQRKSLSALVLAERLLSSIYSTVCFFSSMVLWFGNIKHAVILKHAFETKVFVYLRPVNAAI